MTKLDFDLLSHTVCDFCDSFAENLEPIELLEDLRTDFKSIYFFPDFASVLWARQYLVSACEPFQIVRDLRCDDAEYIVLCNVPWQ